MMSYAMTILSACLAQSTYYSSAQKFVPDGETAIKIATAILDRRYQPTLGSLGYSYQVQAYKGYWIVIAGPGVTRGDAEAVGIALDMTTAQVTAFGLTHNANLKRMLDEIDRNREAPLMQGIGQKTQYANLCRDAGVIARAYAVAFVKSGRLIEFDSRKASQRAALIASYRKHQSSAKSKALLAALSQTGGYYFVSSPSVIGVKPSEIKPHMPLILVFSRAGQFVGATPGS